MVTLQLTIADLDKLIETTAGRLATLKQIGFVDGVPEQIAQVERILQILREER